MVSLSQSWEGFHKTLGHLKGLEKEIANKVIEIMTKITLDRGIIVPNIHGKTSMHALAMLDIQDLRRIVLTY